MAYVLELLEWAARMNQELQYILYTHLVTEKSPRLARDLLASLQHPAKNRNAPFGIQFRRRSLHRRIHPCRAF